MKLIVFGVILWCSLFGNYSWAQKVDTTKVYNIDEVVVSAKRVQKEVIPVQTMEGYPYLPLRMLNVIFRGSRSRITGDSGA